SGGKELPRSSIFHVTLSTTISSEIAESTGRPFEGEEIKWCGKLGTHLTPQILIDTSLDRYLLQFLTSPCRFPHEE
ncbi:unnamed protein product, partial [Linum tenue]